MIYDIYNKHIHIYIYIYTYIITSLSLSLYIYIYTCVSVYFLEKEQRYICWWPRLFSPGRLLASEAPGVRGPNDANDAHGHSTTWNGAGVVVMGRGSVWPIFSMVLAYSPLFTYIWVFFWADVGKYSSTMEHLGEGWRTRGLLLLHPAWTSNETTTYYIPPMNLRGSMEILQLQSKVECKSPHVLEGLWMTCGLRQYYGWTEIVYGIWMVNAKPSRFQHL